MINNEKEYIVCAAIWFHDDIRHYHQPFNIDSGFVVCGHRHHNCYTTLSIIRGEDLKETTFLKNTQGFLTNTNKFVNRREAWLIACEAGQLSEFVKDMPKSLFSEDLY